MRDDNAVAPVVAAMLVLAVIVTFFSVWNAVYLPSLKEQSEMTQDRDAVSAISLFSADISTAATLKREMTASQPFPMGGGGTIFSPLSSAGTVRVNEEPKLLYTVGITDSGIDYDTQGRLVNFSYRPVNDFWIDQGYTWHYGYINVTQGSSLHGADGAELSTPLSYPSMKDAYTSTAIAGFARSLVGIEARPWYNSSANCSHITISSVSFHPEPGMSFLSGNGIGTLALAAAVNETEYGVPETTSPNALIIRVSRSAPEPFSLGLYNHIDERLADLAGKYPGNLVHTSQITALYNETSLLPIPGSLPLTLTHHHVAINVSAY